jgi:hypothetical protein
LPYMRNEQGTRAKENCRIWMRLIADDHRVEARKERGFTDVKSRIQ